jgi:hypothetical protein
LIFGYEYCKASGVEEWCGVLGEGGKRLRKSMVDFVRKHTGSPDVQEKSLLN